MQLGQPQIEKSTQFLQIFEQMIKIVEEQEQQSKPLTYTVKQTAEIMQVSIPTLRDHFLCRPDFPQVWAGTKCLIPRKALEEWINQQAVMRDE